MIGSATKPLGSEAVTNGIRIQVVPSFIDAHSDVERGRFIFSYKVQMTNEGADRVRLVSRTWKIVDADGSHNEVNGPGVVGQHPDLAAGETFEYSSFCPLPTPWGTMEGHFLFEREDKSTFEAQVARFYFAAPMT
ncbi:MAG: Co2+/Mg2+ efflux protein ApaG [Planctomycetota bacterium]|nr:Co2+/Mg2+ efflux protein ApaG [Planctomycetota bacterium]MDA1262832.1 Co2+/Mg2+ efflux protein ApaG [Planctomycetota bacterium]